MLAASIGLISVFELELIANFRIQKTAIVLLAPSRL